MDFPSINFPLNDDNGSAEEQLDDTSVYIGTESTCIPKESTPQGEKLPPQYGQPLRNQLI